MSEAGKAPAKSSAEQMEQARAFIDLYKQQMERFHQTQHIEWKANFGIWTLLAAGILMAVQYHRHLHFYYRRTAIAVFILLVVAIHGAWLLRIHSSEGDDKKLWIDYRKQALSLLGLKRPLFKSEESGERAWWVEAIWLLLEVSITGLLAFAFGRVTFTQ